MQSATNRQTVIDACNRYLKTHAGLWLLVLLVALALKWHYSRADSRELAWILAPTAALAGAISGTAYRAESGSGYVSADRWTVIAPACAGVNFLIAAFCLAALYGGHRIRCPRRRFGWVAGALVGAFLLTVAVNALRIRLAVALYGLPLSSTGLTPAGLHRLAGVAVYMGALTLLHGSLQKAFAPPRNGEGLLRRAVSGLPPPTCYLSVTLGLPFVNGALSRDGAVFLAHARVVAGGTAAVFLAAFLLHWLASHLRSRNPIADGSPIQ